MDILSIGEPLMEFSEQKTSQQESAYIQGYGGDTSNFTVAASRQEVNVGYQTRIGSDAFGDKFMNLWASEGIDTSQVSRASHAHTGVYFITYTDEGHQFTYLRKNAASTLLEPNDLSEELISKLKVLHVSGISQAISESSCDTIFQAIKIAREHNVLVSYDPNVRNKLWPIDRAKAIIHSTAVQSDIYLPSLEDAQKLTGFNDSESIINYYLNSGINLLALKMGKEGVIVATPQECHRIEGFTVDTVDATGAGDTFDGAFVTQLLRGNSLEACATYANAAAALSTTGYGAVESIPAKSKVDEFLRNRNDMFDRADG